MWEATESQAIYSTLYQIFTTLLATRLVTCENIRRTIHAWVLTRTTYDILTLFHLDTRFFDSRGKNRSQRERIIDKATGEANSERAVYIRM